jgi:hypothetical protein
MKDLTKVNGIEVVVRENAHITSPNDITRTTETPSIHRLLLVNDTEIFQCMHKNGVDCTYTAQTAKSVASHQRTHSDALLARRAVERANAAEKELAERKQRRADGSRKGAQTRRQRNDEVNAMDVIVAPPGQSKTLAQAINRVTITANAVDDALEAHRGAVLNLIKITNEIPAVDPQIIAKAKQYDILKSALHGV